MAGRAMTMPATNWTFYSEVLAHPFTVGALAPSSARLAREAVLPIPGTGEPTVVELGAGTGVFTREILRRLGGRGHFLAVMTTVAYSATRGLGPARRFEARLRDHFDEVIAGRTVWRNFLPAMVYYARRPKNQ